MSVVYAGRLIPAAPEDTAGIKIRVAHAVRLFFSVLIGLTAAHLFWHWLP